MSHWCAKLRKTFTGIRQPEGWIESKTKAPNTNIFHANAAMLQRENPTGYAAESKFEYKI